jgi:hypothetical protein
LIVLSFFTFFRIQQALRQMVEVKAALALSLRNYPLDVSIDSSSAKADDSSVCHSKKSLTTSGRRVK